MKFIRKLRRLIMSLIDWFKDKIKHPSHKYIYHRLNPAQHVDVSAQPVTLEAGKHYFRLWLSEMYLTNDVEWFQKWHPALHSLIIFQFGSQKVEIPHIAGSLNLPDFKANNLERVLHLNYPMTTLMPFNGGVVEVAAGLLAMKGQNYLNNFIKVMGDFSNLLVVPQLSAALAIAGPVANGIQTLLGGAEDGRLELGLHQAFTGAGGGGAADMKSGYIAVIAGEETKIKKENLWVAGDRLRYGNSKENNQPLTGYTYMLFRIESRTERDDWSALSNIAEPFNKSIEALGQGEMEKAESLLRTTIVTALQSPDLTRADRSRVVKAMKEAYDQAKKDIGLGAVPSEQLKLEKAMQKAVDVETALNEPEPTLEDLFGVPNS
jgi:hypothetical protein